jgi:hypothetical protein
VRAAPLTPRPLGEVHPADRCAYCGQDGTKGWLDRVTIRATLAVGWLCRDAVECVRRQESQRQLRLFGG